MIMIIIIIIIMTKSIAKTADHFAFHKIRVEVNVSQMCKGAEYCSSFC